MVAPGNVRRHSALSECVKLDGDCHVAAIKPFTVGPNSGGFSALALHLAKQGRQPGQIFQYEIGERCIGPTNVVATPRPAFK